MPDINSKNSLGNAERPAGVRKPEGTEHKDSKENREIREKSREFVEGVSEVVEGTEMSEIVDGEVGEVAKEGKKKAPAGGTAAGDGDTKGTQVAAPKVEVMRIQISTKIKKEIVALEKEYRNISRSPAQFSPFKLAKIVAKIRELKDVLANMADASAEYLKNLWQRYVKGVKS